MRRALDEHGRIDVLVNNVGAVRLRLQGFLGTSDEEFEWAMQMNFFSALRATRAAIVEMVKQGSGAIVNVASVNAFFQPDAGTIDYGAAKAALVNLTKTLSQEFGPRGIRVNAVSPGPVSTDLWLGKGGVAETVAKATGVDSDTARKNVIASIGGFRHRAIHDARGGRHAGRLSRVGAGPRTSPARITSSMEGSSRRREARGFAPSYCSMQ